MKNADASVTMPRPVGRPTDYKQETADTICERLADGESLRAICRDNDMPSKATVFRWLGLHEEFSDQYARARETQADSLFDDVLEIADDARNDWMEKNGDGDNGWQVNGEHVQRTRLRIDARKWMAGKLRPKVYGEKSQLEHTSPDGTMTPKALDLSQLPTETLEAIVKVADGQPDDG